jgi:signal peptide peptidase SppA
MSQSQLLRIAARVLNTPLLLHPEKLDVILNVLGGRIGIEAAEITVKPKAMDQEDEEDQREDRKRDKPYAVINGAAIIPVHGSLVQRYSWADAMSGLTSYEWLDMALAAAMNDAGVSRIVMDIDSPGGETTGAFDLADAIYAARGKKPMTAMVNEAAFSAAYLLASAADEIIIPRTGGLGSIGVVAAHVDVTGQDEQRGHKWTHIYAGKQKVDYSPHLPLSDAARGSIQAEVDRLYGIFVDTVARNRRMAAEKVRKTEAACFFGRDAVSVGLADRIGTFKSTLAKSESPAYRPNHAAMKSGPDQTRMEDQRVETEATTGPAAQPAGEVIDINAARREGGDQARAHAAAIAELCSLAGAPERAGEFIAANASEADVRKALLKHKAEKGGQEIVSVTRATQAPAQTTLNANSIYAKRNKAMTTAQA